MSLARRAGRRFESLWVIGAAENWEFTQIPEQRRRTDSERRRSRSGASVFLRFDDRRDRTCQGGQRVRIAGVRLIQGE